MIDLHCHILPGIDDGAVDDAMALEMARLAASDGVFTVVCTPHILPGRYENTAAGITAAVRRLDRLLADAGIPLNLAAGADVHLAPMLATNIRDGRIPTLAASRYFLFEPPHKVLPPRMTEVAGELIAAGYVPIVTHPERLTWIDTHYAAVEELARLGAPMQITAGSLLGNFGRRAKYWSERMLDEGLVAFIASDGHDPEARPPVLAEARDAVAAAYGDDLATRLFVSHPMMVLENKALPTAKAAAAEPAAVPTGPERRTARLGGAAHS
jgi:protein-tyrosine phosphatase